LQCDWLICRLDAEAAALSILCAEEMIVCVPELAVWFLPFLLVASVDEIALVQLILESAACRYEPMSYLLSAGKWLFSF
jgi:hypothetical protein